MRFLGIASIGALSCALAVSAMGCASGGGGQTDGSTGGGRDGGTRRDGGEFSGCDPRGWAGTCQMATDLGMLMSGGRLESELNLVERRAGAQWAQIRFPLEPADPGDPPDGSGGWPDGGAPSMRGGGTPRIRFLRNDGDAYRMEIRTACTAVASCGEGSATEMATNITEWSITDDPAMSEEGHGQFSTREAPWPETVYLRVYAAEDPDCGRYQIEITR